MTFNFHVNIYQHILRLCLICDPYLVSGNILENIIITYFKNRLKQLNLFFYATQTIYNIINLPIIYSSDT